MSAAVSRRIEPSGWGWTWRVEGGMHPSVIRYGRAWTYTRAERDSAVSLARVVDDMNKREPRA